MTQKAREELSSFRSPYLPVKQARYDVNGEDISYSMKLSTVRKLLARATALKFLGCSKKASL